ncbi:MAG: hypothetical protein ABSA70_16680 [Terriglobia bacterium]
MTTRHKLFLDTSVCSHVAGGKCISAADWSKVQNYISENCEYVMSPITLYELLNGFDKRPDEEFLRDRKVFEVLCPPQGRKRFLRWPSSFVLDTVFGDFRLKKDFEPNDLDLWVRVVLAAPDKVALRTGKVTLPDYPDQTFALRLEHFEGAIEKVKQEHIKILEELAADLRAGAPLCSVRNKWAATHLKEWGRQVTDEDCSRLAESLDVAFHHDDVVWGLVNKTLRRNHYNVKEDASAVLDRQQLYYLCDPTMLMLTDDSKLVHRVKGSAQQDRLLKFEDLLRCVEDPSRRGG